MKATVNENCIGCGLCAGTCPVVFTMGDDGLAHGGEIPANQQTDMQSGKPNIRLGDPQGFLCLRGLLPVLAMGLCILSELKKK